MAARPQTRRGYFLPGFIALVALLGIGILLAGGGDLEHPPPRSISGADMDQQLAVAIEAAGGASSAPTVHCPPSEPVRQGLRFTCTVEPWDGAGTRALDVTEISTSGQLRWSFAPPSPGPAGAGT